MRNYRFLFDRGEVIIKAESLGAASQMLAEHHNNTSGFLRTVECDVDSIRPEFLRKTFEYEADDAKFLVEWDSEPGSGDGWNEPRTEAHAWVTDLWIWQAYSKPQPGVEGRWVRLPLECLNKAVQEGIESECNSAAGLD